MPIRLVCPSCSAALSVKDEYAGRAVKCPKCGGVIPASSAGAAAPTPSKPAMPSLPTSPPPAPPAFDAVDDAEKPKPKITARATAKPAAKAADTDDDEVAKPAKKKGRDEDDRDDEPVAPKAKKKRGDDEDDDRPARKKRRGDDEDDGDGPKKKKGGSNALMIVAVICGTLLLCCGGSGFGVYYYIIKPVKEKVQETVQRAEDEVKTWNFQVNKFSYDELEVGESTRSVADAKLGSGRVATDADLQKLFADEPGRIADWTPKVNAKRAVVWQNGQDYVIAAFHPNAEAAGRLQAKEWRPKGGGVAKSGELDDAKFLKEFPVGGGPGTPATAVELAQAYNANAATAGTKYLNKVLLVEGKVVDVDYNFNNELTVILEGAPKPGGGDTRVRVIVAKTDVNKTLGGVSRGQTVKMKGKVTAYIGFGSIDLKDGTFDSASPDGGPTLTAAALFSEYAKDADATDTKYKDKSITVTFANVERKEGDGTLIISPISKKVGTVPPTTRIQVYLLSDDNFKKQYANVKAGDRVTIKGEYTGSFDNKITIARAWLAP